MMRAFKKHLIDVYYTEDSKGPCFEVSFLRAIDNVCICSYTDRESDSYIKAMHKAKVILSKALKDNGGTDKLS